MTLRQLTIGSLVAGLALFPHAAAGVRGEEGLPTSAEGARPILVGTPVPDGALKTAQGRETTLHELLDGQQAVLVFYRGHW